VSSVTTVNPQTAQYLARLKYWNGSAWTGPIVVQVQESRFACWPQKTEDVSSDSLTSGPPCLKNSLIVAGELYFTGFASIGWDPDMPYTVATSAAVAVQFWSELSSASDVYYFLGQKLEEISARGAPMLKVSFQGSLSAKPPEIGPAATF